MLNGNDLKRSGRKRGEARSNFDNLSNFATRRRCGLNDPPLLSRWSVYNRRWKISLVFPRFRAVSRFGGAPFEVAGTISSDANDAEMTRTAPLSPPHDYLKILPHVPTTYRANPNNVAVNSDENSDSIVLSHGQRRILSYYQPIVITPRRRVALFAFRQARAFIFFRTCTLDTT